MMKTSYYYYYFIAQLAWFSEVDAIATINARPTVLSTFRIHQDNNNNNTIPNVTSKTGGADKRRQNVKLLKITSNNPASSSSSSTIVTTKTTSLQDYEKSNTNALSLLNKAMKLRAERITSSLDHTQQQTHHDLNSEKVSSWAQVLFDDDDDSSIATSVIVSHHPSFSSSVITTPSSDMLQFNFQTGRFESVPKQQQQQQQQPLVVTHPESNPTASMPTDKQQEQPITTPKAFIPTKPTPSKPESTPKPIPQLQQDTNTPPKHETTTTTTTTPTSSTRLLTHEEELQLARIIQQGVELHKLKQEFESTHHREITRQEWTTLAKLASPKELRRQVSNYRRAKNQLVMSNMGLVHSIVRARLGIKGSNTATTNNKDFVDSNGISYHELVQEASLGLLRAAELFDPNRGLRFSTYATIWIKGTLSNTNIHETISLPSRDKSKWNKIQKAMEELMILHDSNDGSKDHRSYQPSLQEIASHSNLDVHTVQTITAKMNQAKKVLSLDYKYTSQGRSGTDSQSYDSLQNDANLMENKDNQNLEKFQLRADVIAALRRNLDSREIDLLRLRFGLKDGQTRSLMDCAQLMGISRQRAQQLVSGALQKLRQAHDAESLQQYLMTIG